MRALIWTGLALALSACGGQPAGAPNPQSSGTADAGAGEAGELFVAADTLARHLDGRFDSSAQAETSPQYFPVQLQTCRAEAPEFGPNVLYVEQAMLASLDAPYRQRLYVVEAGGEPSSKAVSRVYELVKPRAAVHACAGGASPSFVRADAIELPGCRVELGWTGDHFEGGTVGTECLNDHQGAVYATSEVAVFADGIKSWDRGYDAHGKQVWGAVVGPYVFDRKTPMPQ